MNRLLHYSIPVFAVTDFM